MFKRIVPIILIIVLCFSAFSQDPTLTRFEKIRSDSKLKGELAEIVESAVRNIFGEGRGSKPSSLDPILQDPFPLFVTAKKGEEVRGCMGNLKTKKASLTDEIFENVKLAFTKDPQHRPIQKSEVKGMEIFVTAVGAPTPITRIDRVSPARDGILIRSGSKEAVVLPGEAKTLRYLLAFAKTKAGIKRGESFQVYRLPSATIAVKIENDIFSPAPQQGAIPK